MAWIQQKKRSDGGTSAAVRWRLGGARSGPMQTETFSAGSDDQNLARADGFRRMVEAGGHEWPDGWVKGMGFVRPRQDADPMQPPPTVAAVGEEYVRQIVDLSPGQRKRYLDQVRILASVEVPSTRGAYRPFDQPVTSVHEADVKAWLIDWDRSEEEGQLPRPAVRRLQLRPRTRLPHGQPLRSYGTQAITDPPVASRPAVPHRGRASDSRTRGWR